MRSIVGSLVLATLIVSGVRAGEPAPREAPGPEAIYAYAGRYSFRIDARNRYFRPINRGQAFANVSGNRASIRVRAEGYREATVQVFLREGQYRYNVTATLDDPSVSLEVRDESFAPVHHRSRDENNMVWADEFRFSTRVLSPGYTEFTRDDLEVKVNGLPPFGAQIRVSGTGASKRIEVTFRRRDLRQFTNRIRLVVPSDESLGRRATFAKLHADLVD